MGVQPASSFFIILTSKACTKSCVYLMLLVYVSAGVYPIPVVTILIRFSPAIKLSISPLTQYIIIKYLKSIAYTLFKQ